MPRQQAEPWSIMAKRRTGKSRNVKPAVASMPHIGLGYSATMAPPCRFVSSGWGCPCGASDWCSRIRRSTHRKHVRSLA
ncbi:MAG: hypothetical protein NZR01_04930 [Bryobacteraceae bacterium]|nr:hypothetical protein [Bryobacteraceae bacterium]